MKLDPIIIQYALMVSGCLCFLVSSLIGLANHLKQ